MKNVTPTFLILAAGILLLLVGAYANHFENGFYFDDSHTIKNNQHIRSLKNIPKFFTDGTTTSIQPGNQTYRPMVTTLNAIDYWLGGNEGKGGNKINPFPFHLSIFFWYIVQLILMFFMIHRLLSYVWDEHEFSKWASLLAVGLYALHTSNAETINYIIARSDSFSTLCVVAGLLLFQIPRYRKKYLYLIPLVIGLWTKQTMAVFPLLLTIYVLFFEEKLSLKDGVSVNWRKLFSSVKQTAVAWFVGVGLFLFNQTIMSPNANLSYNKSVTSFDYLITQFFVMARYIGTFILPIHLSADPDIQVISNFTDHHVILGLLVILLMLFIAYKCYENIATRPVTYGILWFYIALAPTSSILPRFQIANDHRTFFPYIGLFLAVVTIAGWWTMKKEKEKNQSIPTLRYTFIGVACLLMLVHAYGVHQRNKVWHTAEALWADVMVKSPKNPRGYINHGLQLLNQNENEQALSEFNQALKLDSTEAVLHVNLAAVKRRLDVSNDEIESHYKKAMKYGDLLPSSYFYYGKWLIKLERYADAKRVLEKGARMAPGHQKINTALAQARSKSSKDSTEKVKAFEDAVKNDPSEKNLLDLSEAYYSSGQFNDAIAVCERVLLLKNAASRHLAYNNMCSSLCKLKKWDEAIEACEKALAIKPDFPLAKGNLNWAKGGKAK